jgi:ADP-heptose:LPS heptosyltransferase
MPAPPRKILITRTDRIGDVILSLPAAHAIKQAWPDVHVTFLVAEPVAPIVRMCPWVDDCLTTGPREPVRSLAACLRAESFDAAICLYPRAAIARALRAAHIPLRVGTSRRWYSLLFNRRVSVSRAQGGHHESEYNMMILSGLPIPFQASVKPVCEPSDDAMREARIILGEHGISPDGEGFVVVHPGCGGSARNWGLHRYKELIERLIRDGRRVVITGSSAEAPLADKLAAGMEAGVTVLAGRTDLETLAAILKSATVFVGPSTGPMHLAAAAGTPVVALFGPVRNTTPDRWGPLGEEHKVLMPPVPVCDCKVNQCRQGDCMDLIKVEEVVAWVLAPTK